MCKPRVATLVVLASLVLYSTEAVARNLLDSSAAAHSALSTTGNSQSSTPSKGPSENVASQLLTTDASGRRVPAYETSAHLGVQHCALPGYVSNDKNTSRELVMLHVWLRVVRDGSTAHAKGFLFMEALEQYKANKVQLAHATFRRYWPGVMELSSATTSSAWNLTVAAIRVDSLSTPSSFHLSFPVSGSDADIGEFQLRVPGFEYFCHVTSSEIQPGSVRLSPSGRSLANQYKPSRPNTHFVISPFFELPVEDLVVLLKEHIAWHAKLGVTQHILYVQGGLGQALHNADVQAMVQAGRLRLVQWVDMPPHEHGWRRSSQQDQYSHQQIIYNHALLAHWLEDVWVVVGDLDEYTFTTQGRTIPQAIADCTTEARDGQIGILEVKRFDALCPSCGTDRDLATWRSDAEAAKLIGLGGPLLQHLYKLDGGKWWGRPIDLKSVVDPTWVDAFTIHKGHALLGYVFRLPDDTCMKVVHLSNLLQHRREVSEVNAWDERSEYWWPAAVGSQSVEAKSNVGSQLGGEQLHQQGPSFSAMTAGRESTPADRAGASVQLQDAVAHPKSVLVQQQAGMRDRGQQDLMVHERRARTVRQHRQHRQHHRHVLDSMRHTAQDRQ